MGDESMIVPYKERSVLFTNKDGFAIMKALTNDHGGVS